MRLPVILIFDVGKTNKKILLFNAEYKIVYEESIQIEEINDEDSFPSENVIALTEWIKNSFQRFRSDQRFDIKGINFSAYGASFVYLDEALKVFLPLYNYLKPYPADLKQQFYATYGGEKKFATETASPVLESLNSGMQLYRLKYEKPEAFARIKYALHLPQYLSFIFSSKPCSEITSVGCHTNLWNFQQNDYHNWVKQEGIYEKFAPFISSNAIAGYVETIPVGVGLHDSSAALIPYLSAFEEPFVLLSTGTWCISLNPFNHSTLTTDELEQDCLCYLTTEGKPVKASRLFAGFEHEKQVKKLATHFNKDFNYYETVKYNASLLNNKPSFQKILSGSHPIQTFNEMNYENYENYEEAYHYLIQNIILQQVESIRLVLDGKEIKKIFVDGGFSNNPIYMQLLANAFPSTRIVTGFSSQASALGAAMALREKQNNKNN